MNIGTAMFDELKKILLSFQVKYEYKSKEKETDDSRSKADFYHMAKVETDKFEYFKTFEVEAVRMSGIATSETTINLYASKPELIPLNLRDAMMVGYRKHLLSTYKDDNPYYRMMSGKPNDDDYEFVYVDPETAVQLNINQMTPIHELGAAEHMALVSIGYMTKVIEDHPTKQYLRYVGDLAIDPDDARNVKNFGILRIDNSVDNTLYEQFVSIYGESREYSVNVLYNREFSSRYKYYDEFMGLNILVMTIQRMFVGTYQNVISRDFFDLLTIKNLFDCYQIPFIENLPLERQRLLVKNINKLLYYKSTNRVLNDVCVLLGYEQLNIMQYYLVKKHKLDVNGNPVFYSKTVVNESTGEEETIPDFEKMYELYFQSVDINERNLSLAFTTSTTQRQYIDVVTQDPYWWDEDNELKDKLYEEEFNFIETKYLSINVMHRLSKMIFEVTHFLRMIIDKKPQSRYVHMTLPKLFGSEDISIFDVVVFLSAIISKKNGMMGDILDTTTKRMTVLGFNFRADFVAIKKMINSIPQYDKSLLKYISNLNISNPTDINKLYINVKGIHGAMQQVLATTQDLKTYRAYKKLYKALMITDDTNALFKMTDGTVAKTYLEYLKSEAPFMGAFVEDASEDDLNSAIEHAVHRISILITELKYLSILSEENDMMINALMTLLRFFKSYTTDFTSFDILYVMDDRATQMVKLVSDLNRLSVEFELTRDETPLIVNDKFNLLNSVMTQKERITMKDGYTVSAGYRNDDMVNMLDMITAVTSDIKYRMDSFMNEKVYIIGHMSRSDIIKMRDRFSLFYKFDTNEHITFEEQLFDFEKHLDINDSLDLSYSDIIALMNDNYMKDIMTVKDKLIILES